MKCAVGIDSGGSHYRIKLADRYGRPLCYREYRPVVHSRFRPESIASDIKAAISDASRAAGITISDIGSAVCGIAGVDSIAGEKAVYGLYRSIFPASCHVEILNDVKMALLCSAGDSGIVVASGTGAVAFGRTSDGREARVGGWPFIMNGDEGSGAWLSRNALRALGSFIDGTIQRGKLVDLLMEQLGITCRDDLLDYAYSNCSSAANLAGIGPVIDRAARDGDELATRLLQDTAHILSGFVRDLDHILGFSSSSGSFSVGIWGSVLRRSLVLDFFSDDVRRLFPGACICKPVREAVDYALERAVGYISEEE